MQFPELETSRLKLTALSDIDARPILTLFSDSDVVEYYDLEVFTEFSQAAKLISLFQARFEKGVGIRWGIRLKETNKLIGTCGFNSWSEKMKSAVIGYDLMPEYWGQGYTTEAIHCIVQAAFSGMLPCGEVNRIQADTVPGNEASDSVLKKVGFQEEGIRRQSGYWKKQFHDLKCFGLLKSEYTQSS